MATFDSYKLRVHQRGENFRERTLYYEKKNLKELAVNSLSCKKCKVGGVDQLIVIDDGTLPYYKNIKSLPDEYFDAGDYIEWADSMWLIVSCDWDKEIYTYGKMQQCNYILKWQNTDAEIIERWSVISSASKYNNGQLYNNIIVVNSNQLMVYLPIDSETLKLKSNKRLMVDFNTEAPKCYDVTRVDTVTMGYDGIAEPRYDGKGCILLILTETEINPDTDRIDLLLCDYITPNVNPPASLEISYSGKPEIRIGSKKTFTANTEVTFSLIVANMWVDKIILTTLTPTSCRVNVNLDSSLVGVLFKLVAVGNGERTERLIEVKGAM